MWYLGNRANNEMAGHHQGVTQVIEKVATCLDSKQICKLDSVFSKFCPVGLQKENRLEERGFTI